MSSYNLKYAITLEVTVGSMGVVDDGDGLFHKDFTVPAFKVASAMLNIAGVNQRRIGDESGASVHVVNATTLRLKWFGDPNQPEGLLHDDATDLDEIISVAVEIFDLNELGNSLNELLFRMTRALGYLGENILQDKLHYDDAGNLDHYRLRIFDTRAHCEAATPDTDNVAMEPGELARVSMDQEIEMAKNDRALLIRVLTDVATTPGLT